MPEDDVNARLLAIDPRRRVDRSAYTDPKMPEFPAFTLLQHVTTRAVQVGAVLGCFVWSPIKWIRGGRKEALFATVMPRAAASFVLGGGIIGAGSIVAMAIANKAPNNSPMNVPGVDDRAYRISQNETVAKMNDFVAAGAAAGLMTGRGLVGKGLFGHIGVGIAWATVAQIFIYKGIPKIRSEWPAYRPQVEKMLHDVGIDISLPPVTTAAPVKGKK